MLELAAFVALYDEIGWNGDVQLKPINITVDFRRGGRLIETSALGEVMRLGNRIANVEVTAWQSNSEKPIAIARMNFLLGRNDRKLIESDFDNAAAV